jgi:hypothetical protein
MYEQIKFELSKKTFYTKNNIQKPMFLENKYYWRSWSFVNYEETYEKNRINWPNHSKIHDLNWMWKCIDLLLKQHKKCYVAQHCLKENFI